MGAAGSGERMASEGIVVGHVAWVEVAVWEAVWDWAAAVDTWCCRGEATEDAGPVPRWVRALQASGEYCEAPARLKLHRSSMFMTRRLAEHQCVYGWRLTSAPYLVHRR